MKEIILPVSTEVTDEPVNITEKQKELYNKIIKASEYIANHSRYGEADHVPSEIKNNKIQIYKNINE